MAISVFPFGDFDIGIIISEYLGIFFLASSSIAIGLWISSLTMNQTSAYLITVCILLSLTLINQIATLSAMPTWAADIINYLSFSWHVEGFIKGLIDSRDRIVPDQLSQWTHDILALEADNISLIPSSEIDLSNKKTLEIIKNTKNDAFNVSFYKGKSAIDPWFAIMNYKNAPNSKSGQKINFSINPEKLQLGMFQ